MRFGAWNVRSLYRPGSFTAAARELWTGSSWLRIWTSGGHL